MATDSAWFLAKVFGEISPEGEDGQGQHHGGEDGAILQEKSG